jgi:hypothetical protein
MSRVHKLQEKPDTDSRLLGNKKRQKRVRAAVIEEPTCVPPAPATDPYQVDPKISRSELIGAHTKWLLCTSAFWALGNQCEASQPYVPEGYWFETGRPIALKKPTGIRCSKLTGNEPEVPVVKNCRVKRGLTMVLPAINSIEVACDNCTSFWDPRRGSELVSKALRDMDFIKATLDGVPVSSLDAIYIQTQDGDADYRLATDSFCNDFLGIFGLNGGCPLIVGGLYVFIDTTELLPGPHELLLIGTRNSKDGFCSAVKHKFILDP